MTESRKHYRTVQRSRFMQAQIQRASESVSGDILDLSAGGVGLVVAAGKWDVGDEVAIEFATHVFVEPIVVAARVVRVAPRAEGLHVGFEFTDLDQVDRDTPYILRREFNRRSAPRVWPDEPIEVHVSSARRTDSVTMTVGDLSTSGMRLGWPRGIADLFAQGSELNLAFTLPQGGGAHELKATLRAVRASRGNVAFHVEYVPEAGPQWEAATSALKAYVAQRWDEHHAASRR